VDNRKRKT